MKDPADPKRWIVDTEAADVVQRIFQLTIEGFGTAQIAAMLSKEEILTPINYLKAKGIQRPGRQRNGREPYVWGASSISKILMTQEYCGDVLNFKTYSKSYKNKRRIENAPENIAVFKNRHESIIARDLWERVQEKRGKATVKQPVKKSQPNIFAGLLVCADCGGNLNFHFNQRTPSIIEVFHAEKVDGVHVQRLIIHYNCIGSIDIPDELLLPEPKITVQTRRGVEVTYAPHLTTEERRAG